MNYLKALVILAFFVGATFPADAVAPPAPGMGSAPVAETNQYYKIEDSYFILIIREI